MCRAGKILYGNIKEVYVMQESFVMEILSRLVSKQVWWLISFLPLKYEILSTALFIPNTSISSYLLFISADMEVTKAVDGVFKVRTSNNAKIFSCLAAGGILTTTMLYIELFS